MTVNKWRMRLGTRDEIRRVELNGVDITDTICLITVESSADSFPKVIVEYSCNEVDIEAVEEEQRGAMNGDSSDKIAFEEAMSRGLVGGLTVGQIEQIKRDLRDVYARETDGGEAFGYEHPGSDEVADPR